MASSDGRRSTPGGIWGALDAALQPPTVAQARERLGGPWQGGEGAGMRVRFRGGAYGARLGVVVHGSADERDVWLGAGRIQRVPAADVDPLHAVTRDPSLDAVAADARRHASLQEGQKVRCAPPDGELVEGVLVEKLRYGSLVRLRDGRVLAASFRRIEAA